MLQISECTFMSMRIGGAHLLQDDRTDTLQAQPLTPIQRILDRTHLL
jgi:hypothetical protein